MKKILILFVIILIVVGGGVYYRLVIKQKGSSQQITLADHFGFAGLYGTKNYRLAQRIGAGWVRPEIDWQTIEPKNDEFNFDKFDQIYQENTQKYGFQVMVSLRTGQLAWATKFDPSLCQFKKDIKVKGCPDKYASLPPNDLEREWSNQYGYSKNYYDLVSKTVEHFKDRVDYFVIENEVNTLTFWHGTSDEYLKLRATAYKAGHDANPNVKIIDNGIAGLAWANVIIREKFCAGDKTGAQDFFRLSYQRILSPEEIEQYISNQNLIDCQKPERQYQIVKAIFSEPTFDLLSYHFYEPWLAQIIVIDWLKNEMKKNGYQKPIICTEGGYYDRLHSQTDKETQRLVAEDLIKLHIIAFGEGVEKFIWLPLSEKKENQTADEEYKGLYNSDFQKLTAGQSYMTLVKKIGNFQSVEKKDVGLGIVAYKFANNNQSIYILWTIGSTTIDLSSDISDQVIVTNIEGKESISSGKVITVSQSPIFVEAMKSR